MKAPKRSNPRGKERDARPSRQKDKAKYDVEEQNVTHSGSPYITPPLHHEESPALRYSTRKTGKRVTIDLPQETEKQNATRFVTPPSTGKARETKVRFVDNTMRYGNRRKDSAENRPFRVREPPDYLKTQDYFVSQIHELVGNKVLKDGRERARTMDDYDIQQGMIPQFAQEYFDFQIPQTRRVHILPTLAKTLSKEAATIIGCVAVGGPTGADGWVELFFDPGLRQALVFAIIGLVLREHVFSSLCFGATDQQLVSLHRHQMEKRNFPNEGFSRTRERADKIAHIIEQAEAEVDDDGQPIYKYTEEFKERSITLSWQLYSLLVPILTLNEKKPVVETPKASPSSSTKPLHSSASSSNETSAEQRQRNIIQSLFRIVSFAGRTALRMRLDKHTIYHLQSPYKDQYYQEEEMLVHNEEAMWASNRAAHPRDWDGTDAQRKRMVAEEADLALVRVTCFPALKAYKQGGWLAHEKQKGFRCRDLTKAWVACRWGQQRRWGPPGPDEENGDEKPEYVEFLHVWEAERKKGMGVVGKAVGFVAGVLPSSP